MSDVVVSELGCGAVTIGQNCNHTVSKISVRATNNVLKLNIIFGRLVGIDQIEFWVVVRHFDFTPVSISDCYRGIRIMNRPNRPCKASGVVNSIVSMRSQFSSVVCLIAIIGLCG